MDVTPFASASEAASVQASALHAALGLAQTPSAHRPGLSHEKPNTTELMAPQASPLRTLSVPVTEHVPNAVSDGGKVHGARQRAGLATPRASQVDAPLGVY